MKISVDCKQWSSCGTFDGGCCALNLFGGKPSYGCCAEECMVREPTGHDNNFKVTGLDRQTVTRGCKSCGESTMSQITAKLTPKSSEPAPPSNSE